MKNKKFKIAAIIMIIHGAMMEVGSGLMLMPFVFKGSLDLNAIPPIFAIDFFRNNIIFMIPMSVVFGIARVIGAIGVLKNRKWGFILSVINCILTMNLMLFMIPVGIVDGILACSALVLLLIGYYGNETIN
ncbi:MAG: hypothetical protein J6W46_11025 [Spirochaetaceae bacterium]|nr:hypothetical protein [Spirochaetaceae bacterium]